MMKRFFLTMGLVATLSFFLVGPFIIVGCSNNTQKNNEMKAARVERTEATGDMGHIETIRKFEYNGHKYLEFETYSWDGGIAVIHDPDCKCN